MLFNIVRGQIFPGCQWTETDPEQAYHRSVGRSRDRALGRSTRKTRVLEENIMLWTILVILLVLWLLGMIGGVGGGLIHLLLVVAAIVLIFNLLSGRRSVV